LEVCNSNLCDASIKVLISQVGPVIVHKKDNERIATILGIYEAAENDLKAIHSRTTEGTGQ
jgi:hypothetical protein